MKTDFKCVTCKSAEYWAYAYYEYGSLGCTCTRSFNYICWHHSSLIELFQKCIDETKNHMQIVSDHKEAQMNLTGLSRAVHAANIKWWEDPTTGKPITRNRGELLALIHSEISEALEGERKGLMDDKLPHYPMAAVEIIDGIIRSLDYLCGFYPEIDVQAVFDEKNAYNAHREDHKHESRRIDGGKKF